MVVGPGMLREGERWKSCSRCPQLGLQSPSKRRSDFYTCGTYSNGLLKFQPHCKTCGKRISRDRDRANPEAARERVRQGKKKMLQDPGALRLYRKREARRMRKARAADPEKYNQIQQAYRARVKRRREEDPEFDEQWLRTQREQSHARARRRGVAVDIAHRRYPEPVNQEGGTGVGGNHQGGRLPAGPFHGWLESLIERERVRLRYEYEERPIISDRRRGELRREREDIITREALTVVAGLLGVTARTFYRYRKEQEVAVDVVDRAFREAGDPDAWNRYYPLPDAS